ncbi:Uma2 family endonuclease [Sorangium atrum]|uniref:Uma2 family endonuclease n=1 Tax=Sorangium atrum TaxID=2995308 RepID=A0ABT5CDL1_9BACT|nr:Uma2 family endonuclease [Sorangium aterium]MDC0684527.1 Uma2 family endonuclease [Sorangium aterium]
MAHPARRTGLSPAEYLAFERASGQKYEYANGEIFAISGCTRAHSLLAGDIQRELGNALLARACEVHTSDMRVKITPTGRVGRRRHPRRSRLSQGAARALRERLSCGPGRLRGRLMRCAILHDGLACAPLARHHAASWKMMPTVWRCPERTRLTPCRTLTRYIPRVPCTGR